MTNEDSSTGFALPQELIMLRNQIRRFMREEVKPIEDRLPHDALGCAPEDRARLKQMAEDMGLARMSVPPEYGGAEVSNLARVIIAEETAKCRLGTYAPALGAFAGGPPNILWSGTPEQIEKYAIPAVEGNGTPLLVLQSRRAGRIRATTSRLVR